MTKTLKAAVIGTGFIGPVHVEALRRIGVEVVGILGSSPENGAARAAAMRLPRSFDSLEELLAYPELDAVHITTPNYLHKPMALQAIAAGKHVICEKPLAMDAEEGIELLEAANAAGIVHAVNFNLRFYAQCHEAKSLVESGELGKVLLMHGQYLQDWLLNETDWNWRLEPGLGGDMRVVADIGSHWLDLMTFIGGKRLKEVCADFATLMETRKKPTKPVETFAGKTLDPADYEAISITTEDYASILLRYEDGVHGACTVSQMSAGRKNHLAFEVDCAKASVAFNSENPEQLWIGRRDRASETLLRDPALLSPSARSTTDYPGGHAEGFPDTFKQLYKKVYAAIEAGAPPAKPDYPTFADGVYSLQIGEALLQSARENRWIAIPPAAA
jgi:predicted dehydrogenase